MKKIHLINPMINLGGSELRLLQLYEMLKDRADVQIWATGNPSDQLDKKYSLLRLTDDFYPNEGLLVFVGCYQKITAWIEKTAAQDCVLLHNTYRLEGFLNKLETVRKLNKNIRVVYASEFLKKFTGFPGVVQVSPIDLNAFEQKKSYEKVGSFKVGRHSRNDIWKYHLPDIALYQRLIEGDCEIHIMGGTVLQEHMPSSPKIFITESGAQDPNLFLNALDCFYYRTSDALTEASGRVIVEAMLCGLPLVVHNKGGYCEYIEHGVDGFIFDNEEQAYSFIMQLSTSQDMRKRIGDAARKKALSIYSDSVLEEITQFYLA